MKKKILIVNHSLQHGGIVRSLIAALEVLDSEKYDITLYSHYDRPDLADLVPDYVKVIVNHDKNHYYRKPKSIILAVLAKVYALFGLKEKAKKTTDRLNAYVRSLKVMHPLRDYFANETFDVSVAYSVDICTEIALSIPAKRHYAFYHSSQPDFHRDVTDRCFPKFDKIIAVSPGVAQVVKDAFPALSDKVMCLGNFVDRNYLLAQAAAEEPYASDNVPVICSCGRLSHEKGYDLAVEAAKILRDRGEAFKWYFVGDGAEREKLENTISAYNLGENIEITGFLGNPYPYMAGCDIFVQPSYEEAQPLAVLEAQKLGRAIVSTDTVGGRVILENGEKGVITEINAASLAEGIMSLLENEEKLNSLKNLYSAEDNEKEKQLYRRKWEELLSEG